MRKIYTKIVINMNTNEVIEEESFNYDGEVALCLGGGGDTTQTTEPWTPAQPYLKDILKMSKEWYKSGAGYQPTPYSTVAGFTPLQQLGQNLVALKSYYGSPITNLATQNLMSTLSGQYLSPTTNPYLQAYANYAIQPIQEQFETRILPSLRTSMNLAGRAGSQEESDLISSALTAHERNLGNILSSIYYPAYSTEMNRMMQAAQMAPTYREMEYKDLLSLLSVGEMQQQMAQRLLDELSTRWNYYQQRPYQRLIDYYNLIGNIAGRGSVTTLPYNQPSPIASALSGGLTTAALLGMLKNAGVSIAPWMWPVFVGGGSLLSMLGG